VGGLWLGTQEIDGNDMGAVVAALRAARQTKGRPQAIVLRTRPGKGVARIEGSERSHFFRVDPAEWDGIIEDWERTLGDHAVTASGRTLAMGQDEGGARSRPWSRRLLARRWRGSAPRDPEVVGLTADLGKYTDIHPFRDAFPDRFFNVGMAEQNLVAGRRGARQHGASGPSPRPTESSPRGAPTTSWPSRWRTNGATSPSWPAFLG
jgi:deoxyxylulose-5-phosphate synthase